MMTAEEYKGIKDQIDEIPPELIQLVKDAKNLPAEKIERMFHIKSAVRHMMNTL